MQLTASLRTLFMAFSRLGASAYQDPRLLACPNLSKAPNYGQVLHRYLRPQQQQRSRSQRLGRSIRLSLRYLCTNGGHLCFLLLTRCLLVLVGWQVPAVLRCKGAALHKHTAQALHTQDSSLHAKTTGQAKTQASAFTTQAAEKPTNAPLVLIDTFALLPALASSGSYHEAYLPGLAEQASAMGIQPIRLFRLYGSRHPVTLLRALRVLARVPDSLTDVHMLRWSDYLRLVWHMCSYPVALYRLIRSLDDVPVDAPEYAIARALEDSAGQCILDGAVRQLAGARMGTALQHYGQATGQRSMLISWYENQTGNKAFFAGMRSAQKTPDWATVLAGAQLFIWPAALLNNHPDENEHSLGLAPDICYVPGPYFLPQHSQQPYAIGPALRYAALFAPQLPLPPAPEDGYFLFLLSYHPEATRHILQLAKAVHATGQRIACKFHPATRAEDYASLLPAHTPLLTGALEDSLAQARCVVGAGSGALVEAVCLGRPVCNVLFAHEPLEEQLHYLPPIGENELWSNVYTADDIMRQLPQLEAFSKTPAYPAQRLFLRDQLFSPPSPEAIGALFDPLLLPKA